MATQRGRIRNWMRIGTGLVMAGMLGACAATAPEAGTSPEATVAGFYEWYADFEGSPLAGQAYHDCSYLSSSFVREIDALVASFESSGGGYDPFICAQDVPPETTVVDVEEAGDVARVTVQAWNPIYVDVALESQGWLITDIHCNPPVGPVQ